MLPPASRLEANFIHHREKIPTLKGVFINASEGHFAFTFNGESKMENRPDCWPNTIRVVLNQWEKPLLNWDYCPTSVDVGTRLVHIEKSIDDQVAAQLFLFRVSSDQLMASIEPQGLKFMFTAEKKKVASPLNLHPSIISTCDDHIVRLSVLKSRCSVDNHMWRKPIVLHDLTVLQARQVQWYALEKKYMLGLSQQRDCYMVTFQSLHSYSCFSHRCLNISSYSGITSCKEVKKRSNLIISKSRNGLGGFEITTTKNSSSDHVGSEASKVEVWSQWDKTNCCIFNFGHTIIVIFMKSNFNWDQANFPSPAMLVGKDSSITYAIRSDWKIERWDSERCDGFGVLWQDEMFQPQQDF